MVFFDDKAAAINALIESVEAIETELGLTPAGVYASVRTRLDILESRINNPLVPSPTVDNPFFIGSSGVTISVGFGFPTENRIPGSLYLREDGYNNQGLYARRTDGYWHQVDTDPWTANRDLSGTIYTQTVVGLQNHDINPNASLLQTDAAGDGYVLTWNATANAGNGWWEPQIGFFAAGDLSGNKIFQTVIRLQGRNLSALAPGDGYALTWDGYSSQWEPQRQAIVFDALDNATTTNIRSNRYLTQSPVDNARVGIVNLGSDSNQSTIGVIANYSSILGGDQNVVDGYYSTVVGGLLNANHAQKSFIGGGISNIIDSTSDTSIIVGGSSNRITDPNNIIVGGNNNTIATLLGLGATLNFIGGGNNNAITTSIGNTVSGSVIGGGNTNLVNGNVSFIGSGTGNIIGLSGGSGISGFIGTGSTNQVDGYYVSVINGINNNVVGPYSTILNGVNNLIQDGYCVVNGINNFLLQSKHSFVHGTFNHVNADHSRVWGVANHIDGIGSTFGTIFGANNTIGDLFSTTTHNTLIGHNNTVLTGTPFSTLIGDSNLVGDGYSFVNGLSNITTVGAQFATIFGSSNTVTAARGTVFGFGGAAVQPGQFTHAARSFTTVGDSQFSRLIVDGYGVSGSPFTLTNPANSSPFVGQNNKSYDITVRILLVNTNGTANRARYVYDILAHQTGGTLTIDTSNAALITDNGTGWTVSFSTSSNQLIVTVDSSGSDNRRAMATIEWRELSRV